VAAERVFFNAVVPSLRFTTEVVALIATNINEMQTGIHTGLDTRHHTLITHNTNRADTNGFSQDRNCCRANTNRGGLSNRTLARKMPFFK
jgi:hypothetical protein